MFKSTPSIPARWAALLTVGVTLAAAPAFAAQTIDIPLSGSVAAAGGVTDIALNLSAYLPAGQKATSLGIIAKGNSSYGADDEQIVVTEQSTGYYPYATVQRRNSQGQYVTDTYFTNYTSIIETDSVQDTLTLIVGAKTAEGSDGMLSNSGPYFDIDSYSTGSQLTGYNYYTLNENVVDNGYFGPVATDLLMASPASLNTLNASPNHTLALGYYAKTGEIDLSGLTLTLATAPVPEPGGWLLMILGAFTVGGSLRARRTAARA